MEKQAILTLALDDVVPDPKQPRRHFDRRAMERLTEVTLTAGQLHPIRVRPVEEGWMIVGGQRRWHAVSALAKRSANDERFKTIRARAGGEEDQDGASRRVVQVLSNIAVDLTPTEKAEALAEVRAGEPGLMPAELAGRFGVPEGQVKFLIQLASAAPFIRALGIGSEALLLWNLVTLLRLPRKIRRFDDIRFRESEGAHGRVADREVRPLGEHARRENWGKRKQQTKAERIAGGMTGQGARGGRDPFASIRKSLGKLEGLSTHEQRNSAIFLEKVLERRPSLFRSGSGRAWSSELHG